MIKQGVMTFGTPDSSKSDMEGLCFVCWSNGPRYVSTRIERKTDACITHGSKHQTCRERGKITIYYKLLICNT